MRQNIGECKRLSIQKVGIDGGAGIIAMPSWQGSVIWSTGGGWDHVSVAPFKRRITPSWDDMCMIKDIFFEDDEAVIQIHPPKSEYVNNVPNCLHLWRYQGAFILPPSILIGVRDGQNAGSVRDEIRKALSE